MKRIVLSALLAVLISLVSSCRNNLLDEEEDFISPGCERQNVACSENFATTAMNQSNLISDLRVNKSCTEERQESAEHFVKRIHWLANDIGADNHLHETNKGFASVTNGYPVYYLSIIVVNLKNTSRVRVYAKEFGSDDPNIVAVDENLITGETVTIKISFKKPACYWLRITSSTTFHYGLASIRW